jgi:hypothetical protein
MRRVLYEINPRSPGGWEVVTPLPVLLDELRQHRVGRLRAGEMPVALDPGPQVVVHFIPHGSLRGEETVNLKDFGDAPSDLKPLGSNGWNHRYNSDGFLTESPSSQGKSSGYLQLFRDGMVETVSTRLFVPHENRVYLGGVGFEREVIEAVTRLLAFAGRLEIAAPYEVGIGLLGARGAFMWADRSRHWFGNGYPIDRDVLLVPSVRLQAGDDPAQALWPAFDHVWQATGWQGSHGYNQDGTRR